MERGKSSLQGVGVPSLQGVGVPSGVVDQGVSQGNAITCHFYTECLFNK